jgi:hypothetical protein
MEKQKTKKNEEVGLIYNLALFCKIVGSFFVKFLLEEALKEALTSCVTQIKTKPN